MTAFAAALQAAAQHAAGAAWWDPIERPAHKAAKDAVRLAVAAVLRIGDDCTAEILALPCAGDLASLSFPLRSTPPRSGRPQENGDEPDTEPEGQAEGMSLLKQHTVWCALWSLPVVGLQMRATSTVSRLPVSNL